MRQNVINYFTEQSNSPEISKHYDWFMDSGKTVKGIASEIGDNNILMFLNDDFTPGGLVSAVRDYIDEMDDSYVG